MAGNQNSGRMSSTSTVSRNTGKGRSSQNSAAKKRTATAARSKSGRSTGKRTTRKKQQEYTEPVFDEIKLIIVLAVCILMILSVFGLGGRAGDKAAYVLFGLFGTVTYALPFVLFIGIAFHVQVSSIICDCIALVTPTW